MKGFILFRNVAVVLVAVGIGFSLLEEKGRLLLWLTKWRNPVFDYYFYYITKLAEPVGYLIAGVIFCFFSWRKAISIPLLGAIVSLTSYSLKGYFQHERPSIYLERICYEGPLSVLGYPMYSGHHSFPSGHSMAAWALFTLIAALSRKTSVSILCLWLAFSVSISRIYLLAHFLQDVVFGGTVGIALGYGVYYVYNRWLKAKAVTA